MQVILEAIAADWWPYVGDASLGGWLITLGYVLVAAGSFRAMQIARRGAALATAFPGRDRRSRDRRAAYRASVAFWALLAASFLMLAVNKQLDLHACVTLIVRYVAVEQGWWSHRRDLQMVIVGVVAGGGLATLGVLLHLTRDLLPRHVLAFVGIVVLTCFLIARTTSYHYLDGVLHEAWVGLKFREMLELAGIGCVAGCALANCWWHDVRLRLARRSAAGSAAVSSPA
jgi:hypothetical protein